MKNRGMTMARMTIDHRHGVALAALHPATSTSASHSVRGEHGENGGENYNQDGTEVEYDPYFFQAEERSRSHELPAEVHHVINEIKSGNMPPGNYRVQVDPSSRPPHGHAYTRDGNDPKSNRQPNLPTPEDSYHNQDGHAHHHAVVGG